MSPQSHQLSDAPKRHAGDRPELSPNRAPSARINSFALKDTAGPIQSSPLTSQLEERRLSGTAKVTELVRAGPAGSL